MKTSSESEPVDKLPFNCDARAFECLILSYISRALAGRESTESEREVALRQAKLISHSYHKLVELKRCSDDKIN
jgi:hypothetical protein